MKLVAVATVYDERFTFSRDIEPKLEMTDQDIIEFMVECNGGELIDSCVLVTFEDGEAPFTEELIDQ